MCLGQSRYSREEGTTWSGRVGKTFVSVTCVNNCSVILKNVFEEHQEMERELEGERETEISV